jgi:hypothetical protein
MTRQNGHDPRYHKKEVIRIGELEPISIGKVELLAPRQHWAWRAARTGAPLGMLQSARSQVGPGMWRNGVRRGRAEQAFALRKPGRSGRDHRQFTRRRPPRTATDDQAVKTTPLTRSGLRVLDQSRGPTRARASRNRPLERLRTRAERAPGRVGGWRGFSAYVGIHLFVLMQQQ